MYNPTLGTFIQRDPIGIASGDPNFYRYCGDNPVNRTDPTGLMDSAGSSLTISGPGGMTLAGSMRPSPGIYTYVLPLGPGPLEHVALVVVLPNGQINCYEGGGAISGGVPTKPTVTHALGIGYYRTDDQVSSPYKTLEEADAAIKKNFDATTQLPYGYWENNSNGYIHHVMDLSSLQVKKGGGLSATDMAGWNHYGDPDYDQHGNKWNIDPTRSPCHPFTMSGGLQ